MPVPISGNSNLGRIFNRFRDKASFSFKNATLNLKIFALHA